MTCTESTSPVSSALMTYLGLVVIDGDTDKPRLAGAPDLLNRLEPFCLICPLVRPDVELVKINRLALQVRQSLPEVFQHVPLGVGLSQGTPGGAGHSSS